MMGQFGWNCNRGSKEVTGLNSDPGSSCVPREMIGMAFSKSKLKCLRIASLVLRDFSVVLNWKRGFFLGLYVSWDSWTIVLMKPGGAWGSWI